MGLSQASRSLLDLDAESLARLLASALGPDAGPAREDGDGGHVEAGLLARYALQPEGLSHNERERCGAHLEVCADCRQDLELSRTAVLAAREGEPEREPARPRILTFAVRRPAARVAQRIALAAGLILAAGSAFFIGSSLQDRHQRVLSGVDFDGVETMTARESILVNHSTLRSGARVALEGGEVVAFGEGFSVEEGAGLTISIGAGDSDEASG